jgi:hypothetical protein
MFLQTDNASCLSSEVIVWTESDRPEENLCCELELKTCCITVFRLGPWRSSSSASFCSVDDTRQPLASMTQVQRCCCCCCCCCCVFDIYCCCRRAAAFSACVLTLYHLPGCDSTTPSASAAPDTALGMPVQEKSAHTLPNVPSSKMSSTGKTITCKALSPTCSL